MKNLKKIIYFTAALMIVLIANDMVTHYQETGLVAAKTNKTIEKANEVIKSNFEAREVLQPERTTNKVDEVRAFILKNYPTSPIAQNLDLIFDLLPEQKALFLIAISGQESGYGTKGFIAQNCFNYFGYLYPGTARRGCYSSKWNSPQAGIKRFIELESGNWLNKFDGSPESLQQFVGNGRYCQTDCQYWKSNVYSIFINLKSL